MGYVRQQRDANVSMLRYRSESPRLNGVFNVNKLIITEGFSLHPLSAYIADNCADCQCQP